MVRRPAWDHQPVAVTHGWNAPNLLRLGGTLIAAAALLAAVVTASFASDAHSRVAAVAHTEAPSVKATGDFLLQVEDMDAQLANALLIGGDTSLKTSRGGALQQYETDRQAADSDLQNATTALAWNTGALAQLHTVVDMFGTYQGYATRALQLDEQANTKTAGSAPLPVGVVDAYRTALTYLAGENGYDPNDQKSLWAQAKKLYDASNADIGDSTDSAVTSLEAAQGTMIGLGLLLLLVLGMTQWRVTRHFHRTVNPGLAAASVAALVLLVAGATSLGLASSTFSDGKRNAFDSVQKLAIAEATSYDANADESRWLLDPAHATEYERAFVDKAEQVAQSTATGTPDVSVGDYESQMDEADRALSAVPAGSDSALGTADPLTTVSDLGFELDNITFPGELDSAIATVHAFNAYLHADGKIRSMPVGSPTALHSAIDFDTDSMTAGTSDKTFADYKQAIEGTIEINQAQFDRAMSSSLKDIGIWIWLPYLLSALVAALALAGLRGRLKEYRS